MKQIPIDVNNLLNKYVCAEFPYKQNCQICFVRPPLSLSRLTAKGLTDCVTAEKTVKYDHVHSIEICESKK